jgi:hypothetical protein
MCLLFQAFLITSLNTIFFSAILAPATGGLFGAPTPGESFHWQIDTTIFSKILTIYFVSFVAPAAGGLFGAPAAPAPAFGGSLFGAPGKIKYPHVTFLSIENTTKFSFLTLDYHTAVPTTPAAGGGLFGSTATPAPAAGGLFGAPGKFNLVAF